MDLFSAKIKTKLHKSFTAEVDMLDNLKMGKFICEQRRRRNLTQQQLADELGITFQAVSKWENGIVFPNIEILPELSRILQVSMDDLPRADIGEWLYPRNIQSGCRNISGVFILVIRLAV